MNAPFQPPALTFADHHQALLWAKEWRSDCLDAFAKAETEIGQLLLALKALGKVKLAQPTRPSFEHLRERLEAKGHWKIERRRFNERLTPIDRLLDFRPQLAHGELDVWHGKADRWLLTLRQADGQCAGPVRWHAYPLVEANRKRCELQNEVRLLGERAAELIARLAPTPTT